MWKIDLPKHQLSTLISEGWISELTTLKLLISKLNLKNFSVSFNSTGLISDTFKEWVTLHGCFLSEWTLLTVLFASPMLYSPIHLFLHFTLSKNLKLKELWSSFSNAWQIRNQNCTNMHNNLQWIPNCL